jgi:hypothetical protein
MDRENQKHGPALQSNRTSHFSFTTFFCTIQYTLVPAYFQSRHPHTHTHSQKFEFPLHFYPTRQGDISNTSDWSDYARVLLFVVSQKFKLKFSWERNAQNITENCSFLYRIKTKNLSTECQSGFPNNGSSHLVLKRSRLEGHG